MHSFILVTHSMNIPLPDTRTRSSSEPIEVSVLYIYTLRGNPAIESRVDKWKNGCIVVLSFLPILHPWMRQSQLPQTPCW